jgi:hypothetical protein
MKAIFQKVIKSEIALLTIGILIIIMTGAVYAMGLNDDDDADGIGNSADLCLGTIIDKPQDWGVNRYVWLGVDTFIVLQSEKGDKNQVQSEYTITQTKGCSCADIVRASTDRNLDKNNNLIGGCTKGTMDGWIKGRSK